MKKGKPDISGWEAEFQILKYISRICGLFFSLGRGLLGQLHDTIAVLVNVL